MRLTSVQEQIIHAVQQRGGRVRSLLRLCDELGINYRNAWDCLGWLERDGVVHVERRPGYPLIISSNPCNGREHQYSTPLHKFGI